MLLPGLCACGSTIQPARWPRVLGSVPAARLRRLATWVRSGPVTPPAGVPAIAWQSTQELAMNTSRPLRSLVGRRLRRRLALLRSCQRRELRLPARPPRRAPCGRAASRRTRRTGRERRPGRSACRQSVLTWPGIRSFLPCRFGTQKLWITSTERSVSSTGRPTGMWISFAVAKPRAGHRVAVAHVPPPALRGDIDAQRGGRLRDQRAPDPIARDHE